MNQTPCRQFDHGLRGLLGFHDYADITILFTAVAGAGSYDELVLQGGILAELVRSAEAG